MPTSVATMNSSAAEIFGRLIIPSVERICTPRDRHRLLTLLRQRS
jgi:hypothetical protein